MQRKPDPLSDLQRRLLREIPRFLVEHGYNPSIRDLKAACRVSSTSVVDYNVWRLVAEGLVERDRHVTRSIHLAPKERA